MSVLIKEVSNCRGVGRGVVIVVVLGVDRMRG